MSSLPAQTTDVYDIAVIGGGVNGTSIARDAAMRGLRVYLCEQGDLAEATSSNSSKIIHGGLRYLENYEFKMVRKALKEREILLNIAPHLITPLGFVLPHAKHLRPRWLVRLGLFLYDNLYRSKLVPRTVSTSLEGTSAGRPLKKTCKKGFIYGDAWGDDARIVILTAKSAAEYGATIATRTMCTEAKHKDGKWHITTETAGKQSTVKAKALVNATGPWAESFLKDVGMAKQSKPLRLVKGSHIVVPRLFNHPNAYTLQTEDGRVVFVFPYEKSFSLIGTTDTPFEGNPDDADLDGKEAQYLCEVVNRYFREQTTPADVIWQYSGVRPLIDTSKDSAEKSASKASRDYSLQFMADISLLNIWGGKLTTHRQLAKDALDTLANVFPGLPGCETHQTPLPGGNMAQGDLPRLLRRLQGRCPWLPSNTATRMVHAYGTLCDDILKGCESRQCLGQHFGGGLYQKEVDHLVKNEWAQTAEDILWRRTKLGLHTSLAEQTALKDYLKTRPKGQAHAG